MNMGIPARPLQCIPTLKVRDPVPKKDGVAYEEAWPDGVIEWCSQCSPGRITGIQQEKFLITKKC